MTTQKPGEHNVLHDCKYILQQSKETNATTTDFKLKQFRATRMLAAIYRNKREIGTDTMFMTNMISLVSALSQNPSIGY